MKLQTALNNINNYIFENVTGITRPNLEEAVNSITEEIQLGMNAKKQLEFANETIASDKTNLDKANATILELKDKLTTKKESK